MRLLEKKEISGIPERDATPVKEGLKEFDFKLFLNQKQLNNVYMFSAFIYDISPPCLHDWAIRNTGSTD